VPRLGTPYSGTESKKTSRSHEEYQDERIER
jgi:hypothetical protein